MPQPKKIVVKATYDFDVDGGAQGAITLNSNGVVPKGAIITSAFTDVRTAMTSGGSATVALAVGGVTIKGATAFDDAAYTGLDAHITAPVQASSTGQIVATVATADLTAGVFDVYVEYIQSV